MIKDSNVDKSMIRGAFPPDTKIRMNQSPICLGAPTHCARTTKDRSPMISPGALDGSGSGSGAFVVVGSSVGLLVGVGVGCGVGEEVGAAVQFGPVRGGHCDAFNLRETSKSGGRPTNDAGAVAGISQFAEYSSAE